MMQDRPDRPDSTYVPNFVFVRDLPRRLRRPLTRQGVPYWLYVLVWLVLMAVVCGVFSMMLRL